MQTVCSNVRSFVFVCVCVDVCIFEYFKSGWLNNQVLLIVSFDLKCKTAHPLSHSTYSLFSIYHAIFGRTLFGFMPTKTHRWQIN